MAKMMEVPEGTDKVDVRKRLCEKNLCKFTNYDKKRCCGAA